MRTTTLFLFVYMQISKWGWPTEQNVVGGHGKHIMALACNDTLSACVCVVSENSLHESTTWNVEALHSGLTYRMCLSVSHRIFYCTALVHLTAKIAESVHVCISLCTCVHVCKALENDNREAVNFSLPRN